MEFRIIKTILVLTFLLHISDQCMAQVSGVNYQIRFNPATCLYEARLIITGGSATSAIQRAQFSAQYSIVVPTGSSVNIAANHMPLQNNQNYGGAQPTIWYISSSVQNPAALAGYDLYSITPTLTPTSFYNNLNTGDTVRLFSLQINPLPICGFGVRPYENGVDPDSSAPGMAGGDFSNGFTIGGTAQKYEANTPSVYGEKPSVSTFETSCNQGITINLNATVPGCQAPLSYKWSGPLDFSSNTQNVSIPQANQLNNGTYKIVLTDNIGCKDSLLIYATAKPDAGPDHSVKCYATGTVTINTSGPGTWSIGNESAGTVVISDPNAQNINVHSFSTYGTYYLIKTFNNCSDTAVIQANNICNCSVTNVISLPENNAFCNPPDAVLLSANTINQPGTYLWQYSLNNQNFSAAPGLSSEINYSTQQLSEGIHNFRRIFFRTDLPNCSDTSNIVAINVSSKPDAGQDFIINCIEHAQVQLNGSGTGYWYLGNMSAGSVSISSVTQTNPLISNFTNIGTYYLVRANIYCSDTTIIIINDLCGCDVPDVGEHQNTCAGSKIELGGTCAMGIWTAHTQNPTGASLSGTVSGKAEVQFNTSASGLFRFIFSVNDDLHDTLQVVVSSLPVINAGEDFDYCIDSGPVTIVAGGGQSYNWSDGSVGSSVTVAPQATTTYIVTGYNYTGCSGTDTITVNVKPKPTGSIPSMPPCYVNENLQLSSGQWSHGVYYQWSGPMGFNANIPQPVIPNVQMENAGMYYLTVTSSDECSASASIQIEIFEKALPVNLINFEGRWDDVKSLNQLNWSTASEINNDYFIIERALTAEEFLPVGRINGSGNSSSPQYYTFPDKQVDPGTNYFYRLRQVDYNQRFTYSKIIKIQTSSSRLQEHTVLMYPNPAIDNIFLRVGSTPVSDILINIYNQNGVNVYRDYISDINENTNLLERFHPAQMPAGVYSVLLSGTEFQMVKRLRIVK
jgi:hypothetical protein